MIKVKYTRVLLVVFSIIISSCTVNSNTSVKGKVNSNTSVKKKVKNKQLYHPEDNAQAEIDKAIAIAAKDDKNVLLQVGGNWCSWCILFDKKVKTTEVLKSVIEKNFVVYHLNYSKENKNKEVLDKLDNPENFGFPVFVILDATGKRIHTQESGVLEEGKGHSTEKVLAFLKEWSPKQGVQ